MLQKEIGVGWKRTKLCYLLSAAKMSILTMATFKTPASWHGAISLVVLLTAMSSKKVYLNHYYFHTFCSKLKTDSKYEPGDFIRHAVFIKRKSHTRPLALASLLQMLVFAVVLICRG